MKTVIALVLLTLTASTVALADSRAPMLLGMPSFNPCNNALANDAAKEALAKVTAFYNSAAASQALSFSLGMASVGSCNTGNLRTNGGEAFIRGVIVNRDACGVNFTFGTETAQKAFAKWAYKALENKELSVSAPLCANVVRRLGLPMPR